MALTQNSLNRTDWREIREQILKRDGYRCTCCTRPEEAVDNFNIDHNVPRGRGGSDRFSNLRTLCRECHEAKHGEGYPPMLEFKSTGEMDEYTFSYFKHFFNEIVPALGRCIGTRFDPKFNLDGEREVWTIALGNVRHADAALATFDEDYHSLQSADYM